MNRYCCLLVIGLTVSWTTSLRGAEKNGLRLAKIKIVMQEAGERTESSTQLGFVPGKRVELKVGEVKTNNESVRFNMAIESLLEGKPLQHLIEVKVVKRESGTDTVLAAPKLLTVEGKPATIQIGDDGGCSLHVDVIVEPVK